MAEDIMRARRREVVITDYELISPIGSGQIFSDNMFSGASGVVPIRGKIVSRNFPVPFAALVKSEPPLARIFQEVLFGSINREQRAAAYLFEEIFSSNLCSIDGVFWGVSEGLSPSMVFDHYEKKNNLPDMRDLGAEKTIDIIGAIVSKRQLRPAELISFQNTCVTGNLCIGFAKQRIELGLWDRAIVGASSFQCNEASLMGMHLLGAISSAEVPIELASCPFSKKRSGFVKGEGAAAILLESREAAEARGAKILASVAGFSSTSDAWRLTDSRDDGRGMEAAIRMAIQNAGITPDEICYINAHGTSTKLNDLTETRAIKQAFGAKAYRIPISSLKSQIGHSLIACGVLEAIACVEMLQAQRIAPTINYSEPDPECDLDYTPNESRALVMDHVLSNSFAFGGQNSCLVFRAL